MADERATRSDGLFGSPYRGVGTSGRGNAPTSRDITETPLLRNMDAVIITLDAVDDVDKLQDDFHSNTERRFIELHVLDSTHLLLIFAE